MKSVKPKSLVIDASVAKQSGGHGAPKPSSRACRAFLDSMLLSPHQLVMTSPIAIEWSNHAAGYAKTWRVQMYSRRRVKKFVADEVPGMERRALSPLLGEKQKAELKKDLHLVYAALAADQLVVSMDEKVRALLRKVAPKVVELARLGWVNPDTSEEQAIQWLGNGCPVESVRLVTKSTE